MYCLTSLSSSYKAQSKLGLDLKKNNKKTFFEEAILNSSIAFDEFKWPIFIYV